jgi:hypothetical protein
MVTLDLKLSRLGHSVSLALNLCSTTQPSCSPHDPINVQTPLAALALSVLRRLVNFSVWPLLHLAAPSLGRYVALLLWLGFSSTQSHRCAQSTARTLRPLLLELPKDRLLLSLG